MDNDDLKHVIQKFCYVNYENYPVTKEDALNVCNRAYDIGLLTKQQVEAFISNFKGKESSR